jgi:hypothetical protein
MELPFLKLVKVLDPTVLAHEEKILEEAQTFYGTTMLLTAKS